MKNTLETMEKRNAPALEIGSGEMLSTVEKDPKEFLLEYGIRPALDLISQDRWYYDLIIGKSVRKPAEAEAFLDNFRQTIGYDPTDNPHKLEWLDRLRERYQQVLSPSFCFFGKKNDYPKSGGEVRLYLSVKQDRLLESIEKISGILDEIEGMYAFKINISDLERNDNLVIYLTEQTNQAEIGKLLEAVSGLSEDSSEVFNEFDFNTPLSRPITADDSSAVVGQLAYNPFVSNRGKAFMYGESAYTPNQLFGRFVQGVKAQHSILNIPAVIINPEKHSEKIKQLTDVILQEKVQVQSEKYGEKEEYDFVEYCRKCLQKLSEILEEN